MRSKRSRIPTSHPCCFRWIWLLSFSFPKKKSHANHAHAFFIHFFPASAPPICKSHKLSLSWTQPQSLPHSKYLITHGNLPLAGPQPPHNLIESKGRTRNLFPLCLVVEVGCPTVLFFGLPHGFIQSCRDIERKMKRKLGDGLSKTAL